ncbi:hypothetical protein TRIP_B210038 [uncultured Desulfatiglans sp.]|uniref:Transposase n=1 Tax=Uncultured Desulfatiglans sp. TaxID=1748965 RepID=A0A653A3S2_UNCDX|nr:hypothetical protein TRIP_B210038 [uncultured Desulfatiglans sp.]
MPGLPGRGVRALSCRLPEIVGRFDWLPRQFERFKQRTGGFAGVARVSAHRHGWLGFG